MSTLKLIEDLTQMYQEYWSIGVMEIIAESSKLKAERAKELAPLAGFGLPVAPARHREPLRPGGRGFRT
jgi:hypothetical protein